MWTRFPYAECKSGASARAEHERGRPPPKISSREGIPVDVRNVDGEDGEGRVPTGASVLIPVFLLNEDIRVVVGFQVDQADSRAMSWRNALTHHARRYTLATLKVRTTVLRLPRVCAESPQLANFAFAIHFFAEHVAAIEYVSRNAFRHDVHTFIRYRS